jgi:hypothetical protein
MRRSVWRPSVASTWDRGARALVVYRFFALRDLRDDGSRQGSTAGQPPANMLDTIHITMRCRFRRHWTSSQWSGSPEIAHQIRAGISGLGSAR